MTNPYLFGPSCKFSKHCVCLSGDVHVYVHIEWETAM